MSKPRHSRCPAPLYPSLSMMSSEMIVCVLTPIYTSSSLPLSTWEPVIGIIHTHYGLAGRRLNSHARAKLHNNFFNVAYNMRYHFIVTINSEEIAYLIMYCFVVQLNKLYSTLLCLHPVQHNWLNNHLVNVSPYSGILLSHWNPDVFHQWFHQHCILFLTSASMTPSLYRLLPIYLIRWHVAAGQILYTSCWRSIQIHVFALETFMPLFVHAPHCCSSSTSVSLAHSITSSY